MSQKTEESVLKKIGKKVDQENKVSFIASFPNLVDLVENEDHNLEFMIFDPTSKTSSFASVVQLEDKTHKPPTKNLLPKNMLFPRKEEVKRYIFERNNYRSNDIVKSINDTNHVVTNGDDVYDMTNGDDVRNYNEWDVNLYEEIINYFQERAELPNDNLYDVIALWSFHTYAMERADFSPIIYFLGLPEKGKSRMLKSMIYIARRGLRKISLTDAQILRDCTNLDATLALDMMNLWKKVETAGSEDVFLNRPEKGIDVSRVNRPEKGAFADTDYYTVFGPTIFATNELINEILDTRAIPIIMLKSKKEFNKKVKPEDALPIKEKLTAWRSCVMGDEWAEVGRVAGSRLGDITQPIYQIVKMVNPAREQAFIDVIKEIEKRRFQEKSDSISGQIFRALYNCRELTEHGSIKGQIVATEFNKDKSEREKYSSRRILNKLKTMGFETITVHGGNMAILWNIKLVDALKLEFNIEDDRNNDVSSPFVTTSTSSPNVTQSELYYSDLADKE